MRFAALSLAPLLVLPLLTQCGTTPAPSTNTVTGPFDDRGNYIEDWVDKPEKWYRPSSPSEKARKDNIAKNIPQKQNPPQREIAKTEQKPTLTVTTPKPTPPKPKPTPPKPKPKPQIVTYTVRKGDTLTKIGRNQGVTVSALRRANGISGDLIKIGQRLKIPK